jgi:flagellar basal-body rod protein FlgG
MTHTGHVVLGENGPIMVQHNNFIVNEHGEIVINADIMRDPREMVRQSANEWSQPIVLDRLKIVDFEYIREIKKEGDSLYRATEFSGPAFEAFDFIVRQGFLEKSNVNVVREMVEMIEVQRAYEANQKTIQSHDTVLGRLINDVSR